MNTSCEVGVHADPVVLKIVCHHVSALKSCCHNHKYRVAYLHLRERLLYPDWRLSVESGDHKEGSITLCSECSSINEVFFLVVDRLRCWRRRVLLFRILAFSLVSSCAVSVLGAIPCKTDRILFQKVWVGVKLILKEISSFLFVIAYRSAG